MYCFKVGVTLEGGRCTVIVFWEVCIEFFLNILFINIFCLLKEFQTECILDCSWEKMVPTWYDDFIVNGIHISELVIFYFIFIFIFIFIFYCFLIFIFYFYLKLNSKKDNTRFSYCSSG